MARQCRRWSTSHSILASTTRQRVGKSSSTATISSSFAPPACTVEDSISSTPPRREDVTSPQDAIDRLRDRRVGNDEGAAARRAPAGKAADDHRRYEGAQERGGGGNPAYRLDDRVPGERVGVPRRHSRQGRH